MRQALVGITIGAAVLLRASVAAAADPPARPLMTCPVDAVASGSTCMDKYEASVWRVPDPTTVNKALVAKIRSGTVTAAALTTGGAMLLGLVAGDYAPCADSGQNCGNDIYAASLPGNTPSAYTTWFQAQQACKNAGKRLPTSAEWQAAAAGTPDPGPDNGTMDCNTHSTFSPVDTGSRSGCVSSRGAFDMVGNLSEWVAEWVPRSAVCGAWGPDVSPTLDLQCLAGATAAAGPGALLRGGGFLSGSAAGPLAIDGSIEPSGSDGTIGFRCAR